MNTLLVIPARGGSKGIPRKNLQLVAGKPLIAYAIENALTAKRVDRVIVSTEDDEIAAIARTSGADTPFPRPADLATDQISLIPVIAHAASQMAQLGFSADLVISLQPTTPLISPAVIDRAITLQQESRCDSVSSVVKVTHNHPYRLQTLAEDDSLVPNYPEGERFLQRQDLPVFYAFSGGLYLRRRELLENWSGRDFCLGSDRKAVVVDEEEALNIDRPVDLLLFDAILRARNTN